MLFSEYSLLGAENKKICQHFNVVNSEIINQIIELGKIIREVIYNLKYDMENGRQVISLCLLFKATNALESIVLLCQVGLYADAKILLRSLFETNCVLMANLRDDTFMDKYIKKDQKDMYKKLRIIRENVDCFYTLPNIEICLENLSNQEENLKKQIKNVKDLKIIELAKLANAEKDYQIIYRLLCEETHCSPRVLEDYLVIENEKHVGYKDRESDSETAYFLSSTAMDFLSRGLELFISSFIPDYMFRFSDWYVERIAFIENMNKEVRSKAEQKKYDEIKDINFIHLSK